MALTSSKTGVAVDPRTVQAKATQAAIVPQVQLVERNDATFQLLAQLQTRSFTCNAVITSQGFVITNMARRANGSLEVWPMSEQESAEFTAIRDALQVRTEKSKDVLKGLVA